MDKELKKKLDSFLLNARGKKILDRKNNERQDGYTNLLNKYGTAQDNSTAYSYVGDSYTSDMELASLYEGNGLFAKIIDRPAEESIKHGLDIDFGDEYISEYVESTLDLLEFEDKFITAEKWARLYGGSIIVMLIDDGGALEDPLQLKKVKYIDDMIVFDRSVVQPDFLALMGASKGKNFGMSMDPEYYQVCSRYGYFNVHKSRCLIFRNGRMPEKTTNFDYLFWGIPEYLRIKNEMRKCITAHEDGVKLMERSVQAIYKMKDLARLLATDEGEDQILKRLQVIDMGRGILNSIAIDNDGEDYDFKNFSTTGVKEILDSTCNMLSAVTSIPQTILFGRSPAGENSTGRSDFENYYNLVENIQKQNVKANVRKLINVILRQGITTGGISQAPTFKVKFNPLWSMSEKDMAEVEKIKADTELVKAQMLQVYSELQAIDPSEIRKSLKDDSALGSFIDGDLDIKIDDIMG